MYVKVAVSTGSVQEVPYIALTTWRSTETVTFHIEIVALPAQPELGTFQHSFVVAAMGTMTVRAIFRNGLMFEEEGTAFLFVARVAQFVRGVGHDEFIGKGAVRIMATRAIHLALAKRHMRKAHLLGYLLLVAWIADFHRGWLGKQFAIRNVR